MRSRPSGRKSFALTDEDVHIWHVDPAHAAGPAQIRGYESLLTQEERERYHHFVFDADRHRHLVARALVRTTLSLYADIDPAAWRFAEGPHGRPEIAGPEGAPPLRFSLSHTDGLVALAVTLRHDVGLDVEHKGRRTADASDIARRFFAPPEAADVERRPEVFLEYWTLKEAYVKATGRGFSLPLDSFAFTLGDPPTIGNPEWHFRQLALSTEHIAALAVRMPQAPSIVMRTVVP